MEATESYEVTEQALPRNGMYALRADKSRPPGVGHTTNEALIRQGTLP